MGFQKLIFITILAVMGLFHTAKGQVTTAEDERKIHINCSAINGNNIFAGTDNGVYLSIDTGVTWTPVNNGLPVKYADVRKLIISGSNLLAHFNFSLFLSTNNGTNWTEVKIGMSDDRIYDIGMFKNKLFATRVKGLYTSADNGLSWTAVPEMPEEDASIAANENYILARCGNNYYSSSDGVKWQIVKRADGLAIAKIGVGDGGMIYGYMCQNEINYGNYSTCFSNVMWILSENGKKLEEISLRPRYFGFYRNNIYAIVGQVKELNNMNFSCTMTVLVSENRGKKWTKINEETDPFLLSDIKVQKKLKELRDGIQGEIDFAKRNAISLALLRQAAREEKARQGPYPCGDPFYIPLQTTSHNYGQKSNDRFQEMNNHRDSYIDSNGGIHIK